MPTKPAFEYYTPPHQLNPVVSGQWSDMIELKNVAAHASLLPNGKILYWGRRSNPKSAFPSSMYEKVTEPWLLDVNSGRSVPTGMSRELNKDGWRPGMQPKALGWDDSRNNNGGDINLFCSGHTFKSDGNLVVVGGHLNDGNGLDQSCIYDWQKDQWFAQPRMRIGRWYPTALRLKDDEIFAISGNDTFHFPELLRSGKWIDVAQDNLSGNYPRMHVTSVGQIFTAGSLVQGEIYDMTAQPTKEWRPVSPDPNAEWVQVDVIGALYSPDFLLRKTGNREYAPSVMYESDKVMLIGGGGGGGEDDQPPTNAVDFMDLNATNPEWKSSEQTDMHNARRHHSATILPDGTVLVTGGSRGAGFNNVNYPNPVHEAELFDPKTQTWSRMAPEREDRCYHGTSLLLPSAKVLSAGGGEWGPFGSPYPNANKDSITNAQLFSPPYLFRGSPQPIVSGAPGEIKYKTQFDISVTLGPNETIERASIVSIGSSTHTINFNQHHSFLKATQAGAGQKVTVTGPDNIHITPPGYYMLFLLNNNGVPSVAPIVKLLPDPSEKEKDTATPKPEDPKPKPGADPVKPPPDTTVPPTTGTGGGLPVKPPPDTTAPPITGTGGGAPVKTAPPSIPAYHRQLVDNHTGPPVVVGVTPVCPYGLGACWAGAFHGLRECSNIKAVDPSPDKIDSVGFVYLDQDILPDIDRWRNELNKTARGSHQIRGIEMTLSGVISKKGEQLTIAGTSTRPEVVLAPYKQSSTIRIIWASQSSKPITADEAGAYAQLASKATGSKFEVTGTLQKQGSGKYSLDVRQFKAV